MLRRIGACILAMLALWTAPAFGAACLVTPELTALVDDRGEVLLQDDVVEDIFAVREGALFAAGGKGDYRLFDASGQLVSDERFAMIHDAGDCLIFRQGNLYGAMDAGGGVILPPEWTQLTADGAGGWLALDDDPLDDQPDEIIRIDAVDEPLRTGVYTASGLAEVRDGRMPFMTSDGRYGAVDARGMLAIEADWHYIGGFSGGLAIAADAYGRGVIDVDGGIAVEIKYAWLDRGATMIVGLTADGVIDVYTPDGTALRFSLTGSQAELVGDCLVVADDDGARLYDAEGSLLLETSAGAAFYAGSDGQIIVVDGEWGEPCQRLINADGSDASGRHQRILPLCQGRYAWIEMSGAAYYSEELGGLQRSWDYGSVRWGLMDGAGNTLTAAKYREIRPLGGERLMMITDTEMQLADLDGNVIRAWLKAGAAEPSA